MDLVIQGDPAELEWLRREIERQVGGDADLEAVPAHDADELREPLIIALIVSLGGPAVTHAIAGILKRRYQHKEEIERIRNEMRTTELAHERHMAALRLKLGDRIIAEDDLVGMTP